MDQLTENIANAALTLQGIIQQARRRRDEQGSRASASPAQIASLRLMQQKAWVNAHWPIAWPHWPPGLWPKAAALAQKVTRRLLAWYINPIVRQQNEFNQVALRTIQTLSSEMLEQQAQIAELSAQVEDLQRRLAEKP